MGTVCRWAACLCHVWPLSPGVEFGRCGWCKQYPTTPVTEPKSGKAISLTLYEAEYNKGV